MILGSISNFCRLDFGFCCSKLDFFRILFKHFKTPLWILPSHGWTHGETQNHSETPWQCRYSHTSDASPKSFKHRLPRNFPPSFTLTLVLSLGFGQAPLFQFLSHVAAACSTGCTGHRLGGGHRLGALQSMAPRSCVSRRENGGIWKNYEITPATPIIQNP